MSAKPIDVMIAGAQKAGTTSLKYFLSQHPNINSHRQTEFAFFANDEDYRTGFEAAEKTYFKSGLNPDGSLKLAKHAHLYAKEEYIIRLAKHNPHCEILFMMRNPVERAFSSYRMEKSKGYFEHSFEEVISIMLEEKEDPFKFSQMFLNLGLYSRAIEIFKKHFPGEQLHFYLFEELKQPKKLTHSIFETLNQQTEVAINFQKQNTAYESRSKRGAQLIRNLKRKNNPLKKLAKSILPPSMFHKMGSKVKALNQKPAEPSFVSKEAKERLQAFYMEHNNRLAKLINRNLDYWNN